jgi:hypothetical protein
MRRCLAFGALVLVFLVPIQANAVPAESLRCLSYK